MHTLFACKEASYPPKLLVRLAHGLGKQTSARSTPDGQRCPMANAWDKLRIR